MFFVMSQYVYLTTRCYTTTHLHQVFFRFRTDFLAFFARISYFKFLELKEFNKTIIPFALVGYETGYSQLGARYAPRWLFTISCPTRAHGIIVNYASLFIYFFILISLLRALNQPTLSVRFSVSFASFLKVGVKKK